MNTTPVEHSKPSPAQNDEFNSLTDDAFLGGALQLLQPSSTYRAGIDAVLLAATVCENAPTSKKHDRPLRVLDVGAGIGTVGLCIAKRIKTAHVTLVEKDQNLAQLAQSNASRNGLETRVIVTTADIMAPAQQLEAAGLTPQSFDVVVANPPFYATGEGTLPKSSVKTNANTMPQAGLETWIRFMTRMCTPSGIAHIIHKAAALELLLKATQNRFGAIRVLPIHPRTSTPANRIIVTGIKGSRAELKICPGLVLHADTNDFTKPIDAILRQGAPLNIPD